jgi:hypothetical protein
LQQLPKRLLKLLHLLKQKAAKAAKKAAAAKAMPNTVAKVVLQLQEAATLVPLMIIAGQKVMHK